MIITRTPYRITFAGGGTDYPEYFRGRGSIAINAAINKHLYVLLTERLDSRTRIAYFRGAELLQDLNKMQHEIVRAVLQRYGITGGIEIATIGEVPAEAGLGSSSAVTVGLVHAVRTHLGLACNPQVLAEEAIVVETEILKRPTGWQDPWGVSFPGIKAISFGPEGDTRLEPLALSPTQQCELERHSLLVFTQQLRRAESTLAEQRENAVHNTAVLDEIRHLATRVRACLDMDMMDCIDLPSLAALLTEHWQAKKTLACNITSSRINRFYETGMDSGAWGGKLLGAGNGGFLFFLAPEEKQSDMVSRMGSPITIRPQLDREGACVVYAN